MENHTDSNVGFEDSSENALKYSDVQISHLSFKRWHRHMQAEHEILERTGKASPFSLWKWCHKGCLPCRWFDSIEYNKKLSKCCLTFKTFKNMITIILVAVFSYAFMFSILGKELLPGGSVFFLFFLFLAAYLVGYTVTLVGMPGMIGQLVTGITFGNVPRDWLPDRDEEFMEESVKVAEKILFVLALIRSGLLLDLSRMKNRFKFIFFTATFPFCFEFFVVWVASYFLLNLEWEWGALQGSTISIVSLATVTSIMEKNKVSGYGEDKHLSTVLIAAAVINVLFGLILYFICLTYVILGLRVENQNIVYWKVLLSLLKQSLIGIALGLISGFLVAFFPDKRHPEAPGLRIITIGLGSFGITSFFNSVDMNIAGAIACVLLCFICANMWEELGWHQDSNPVLYFYTMAYYIAQPMVLSLLGYTLKFKENSGKDIGLSLAVFLIGLMGRELMCFLVLQEKSYPTKMKEKIFICIAWLTKGTFQALLAFSVMPLIEKEEKDIPPPVLLILKNNSNCIRRTTVLAILLITPIVCYALTLLAPKLLTTYIEPQEEPSGYIPRQRSFRRRLTIVRYQDTVEPQRRKSIRKHSEFVSLENYTAGRAHKNGSETSIDGQESSPVEKPEKKTKKVTKPETK